MKLTESQALKRMADYCSRAERCSYDIRRKLTALELEDYDINNIIERLKKERFLDELRFCHSFINDKIRFNKWGETKIRFELRKRNIPESVYNPILKELSERQFEGQLKQILASKNKTVKGKTEYEKRNKLIRFGLGRGFSLEMVLRCVNKLFGNVPDEDI